MNSTSLQSNKSTLSLWKIIRGKNGDNYLINGQQGSTIVETNLYEDNDSTQNINSSSDPAKIKVYKIRWFILLCICLANISNAINWINFSSIADFTGQFYLIDYELVNYLSLVYLILSTPAGFFSFWLIDTFGVRSSINIGSWLNLIGASIRLLSALDFANGIPIIPTYYKYGVLIAGQCLCALAQPFIMFVATKFANNWFADDQRALANTIALGSNTFGILIGSLISPLIVNSQVNFISQMCFLHLISLSIALIPAVMSCFITRSTPPTPPSFSAIISRQETFDQTQINILNNQYLINNTDVFDENGDKTNFKEYLKQVGKLLKSKDFLILFLSFGLALGLFNSLTTLIEQILCTKGYTDQDAGIFGGVMIICGLIGSVLSGLFLDKTKRFEETAKICFSLSTLGSIMFTIFSLYNNDKSTIYYMVLISFGLIGFFGLPLLPICMDMSVECVYPIPEATSFLLVLSIYLFSTGLLFIAGQIVGIIMIVSYPKLATPIQPNTYIYDSIQTCTTNTNSSSTTTSSSNIVKLTVLDFSYPLYGQTIVFFLITIFFIKFFKCAYLRLRSEREKLAEKILNSAR